MRRLFRRDTWRNDRGAAAVEFALVFPVLILVLIGIIEYGSVFNTQLMLTSAAMASTAVMEIATITATAPCSSPARCRISRNICASTFPRGRQSPRTAR